MKKTLSFVLIALLFSAPQWAGEADAVTVEVPQPVQEVKVLTPRETVVALVDKYSAEYGVSKEDMLRTLSKENDTFQFDRQSGLRYKAGNRWGKPAGALEESYGVAQIHLPDNPNVTYAQAIDPDFSVRFMAQKFSQGRQGMWMGYY